jgi:Flp pilus assembly protein TadG
MLRPVPVRPSAPRRGAAIAEMAILLSILSFLFVVSIDFARLFYYSLAMKNCARNGAYYASDYPGIYAYGSPQAAALADASNFSPAIAVTDVTVGYDSSATGTFTLSSPVRPGYVKVTVNWTFNTLTSYPGIPSTWNLSQSEIMQMAPITPSNFP